MRQTLVLIWKGNDAEVRSTGLRLNKSETVLSPLPNGGRVRFSLVGRLHGICSREHSLTAIFFLEEIR